MSFEIYVTTGSSSLGLKVLQAFGPFNFIALNVSKMLWRKAWCVSIVLWNKYFNFYMYGKGRLDSFTPVLILLQSYLE